MKLKLAARLLLTFLGVFGCACAQSESHVVRMAESVTSTSPFPSPSTASMNNIAGNGTPTNGQVSLWPSKPAFTVRFAASLGSNTDSGSLEARQGYNYWSYMLNEVLGGFCIGLNCQHKLKVDLWILSDNLVPQVHLDNMVAAVEQGNADFLLGGNTNLASYDLEASQTAQRITMLCCHGPAPVYEIAANATKINPNNVDYLFGIQVSSDLYPNKLIRDIVVNEKSKLTAIIQVINTTQPNATAFTSTTCAAAANQLESILASGAYQAPPQYKVITVPIEQSGNLSYFQELSRNIKSIIVNGNHVDIVLACTLNVDGRNLLYSLQSEQVPLKGVFATVAPTIQSTVANLTTSGITMVDTLSAGQWHPELPFVDPNADAIWTNATSFANGFESYMTNSTGKDIAATYNNAGSAAGTFAIQIAIHNAFQFCDLSNWTGDVDTLFYSTNSPCSAGANKTGYELVLESLRTLNRDSFFGTIQFDGNQRNVGRDAVTLQLLGSVGRSKKIFGSIDFGLDADNTTLLVQEVVLPSQYETKQIVLPRAPRSYDPGCPDGQGLDSNNDCQPCPIGTSRTNAIQAGTLSGRFLCDTCNLTSYADKVGQSQCTHCPPGTVTKSKDAAGAFKSILGATSITMCVCAVGYYNETGLTGVPCSPCPSGATCAGDVEPPRATPGYWLDSSAPDYLSDVFSCSPSQYCPMNYATGQLCAAGYGGPLCSLCGYYNGNDSYPNYYSVFGNCITCPNKVENVLVFVAILVLWVLMNFFVIEKWEGTALGLEWLQLMYLVGTINTNWPQSTQQYFNLAKLFAFEVDIVSWQCISSSWNWMWDMVLQFVLPPFLVFCFLFFTKSGTLLKYVWRHGFSSATNQPATLRNSDEQHMKQHTSMGEESMFESMKTHPAVPTTTETVLEAPKEAASGHQRHDAGHGHSSGNTITKASFIGICVSVLEITYVASTYYAFSALAGINVSGTWVVMQAPYTNQTTTVIVIGAVGLVLYSLLYPGVIAFQLWKLSPDCPWRKRPPGQSRDEDAGGFREEENITAYGVLYEKFKVEKYYMAFVHLLHRLVFIAIVAVSEDVNLQLLLGILVTMAFAFLFLWTKPYYLQRTNMLQAILYTSVVVQLGIGTKFNNTFPYNNEAWDQAFAVLSIIAICTAGAGFVWISAMDVIEYICANLANQAVLGYLARRQGMTVKEQNANAHRIAQLVEVFDPVRLWR